jgi:hypothetical protein
MALRKLLASLHKKLSAIFENPYYLQLILMLTDYRLVSMILLFL